MSNNSSQFKINKKPSSKKLPWTKLILAGISLLALIIFSKHLFAVTSATSGISLHSNVALSVLGDQTPQVQTKLAVTTLTSRLALPVQAVAEPAPSPTPASAQNSIKITNTPTGYLNVRIEPSLDAAIISKVHPGEIYTYTSTQGGWYLIQLKSNHYGWIDGEYAVINK
jgi:uncharacterized protein YgiM (DUF1202 family)